MKIGQLILNIVDHYKYRKQLRRVRYYDHCKEEIEREFRLVEKEGTFYVTCGGIAIETFPKHTPLESVQGRLRQLRGVASFYALPKDYARAK